MQMIDLIPANWKTILDSEFDKTYFKELIHFVSNEYQNTTCFPPKQQIFNALNYCSVANIKVVIIGQDPYHDHNQANGLCFSVNEGVKYPPSLVNIFKEIQTDLEIAPPNSGDLSRWAGQGVLLLNTVLTVKAHEANSHQKKGWEKFTDAILKSISQNTEGVVFMLWGGSAQKKEKLIDTEKHHILKSGHPSPLSANRGYWFGNKHFSKANAFLKELRKEEVVW